MLMRSPMARDRRQPPGFICPCQPVLSVKVAIGPGWIDELKHDGFRIVAHRDGDVVRLWSRNGRDWSAEFAAITAAIMAMPVTGIVVRDGEAVACLDNLAAAVSVHLRNAEPVHFVELDSGLSGPLPLHLLPIDEIADPILAPCRNSPVGSKWAAFIATE
jgi:bifunctional non-homologous end joining protein LigD